MIYWLLVLVIIIVFLLSVVCSLHSCNKWLECKLSKFPEYPKQISDLAGKISSYRTRLDCTERELKEIKELRKQEVNEARAEAREYVKRNLGY